MLMMMGGYGGGYTPPPRRDPPVSHPDCPTYSAYGVSTAYLGYGFRPLYLPRYQNAAGSWADALARQKALFNGSDRAALAAAGVDEQGMNDYFTKVTAKYLAQTESDAKFFRNGFKSDALG